jgi:hypothetical protein
MSVGVFLIAILGCGEADAPCETVRTLETRYESQAACTAATEAAVLRNVDVDYPVVVAQCVAAERPAGVNSGDVKRPEASRARGANPVARPIRS